MEIRSKKSHSPLAGLSDLADTNVKEAICPLCGGYGYVDSAGYCGTEECSIATLDYARRYVPKAITRLGGAKHGVTILNKLLLHRYGDPVVPDQYIVHKDNVLCDYSKCDSFARPNDSLCVLHRRNNPKISKRKEKALTHKIKGLEALIKK